MKNNNLIFKDSCRNFRSDRPCTPHKQTGVTCDECKEFLGHTQNILVLKFEALGDVLRSTAILHGLRKAYPTAKITWLTRKASLPFFLHNPYVTEVLAIEDEFTAWLLKAQTFDITLSLDSSAGSAAIAKGLNSRKILGFTTNELGKTIPASTSANTWYAMGLNDQLKKLNTENYFEHMYRIAELEWESHFSPIYRLSPAEEETLPALRNALGLDCSRLTIGLNPGAGGRWRYKRWNENHFVSLIQLIEKEYEANILLLGGIEDQEIINRIRIAAEKLGSNLICPPAGDLRHFGMLVALLDILVCGDTLALHYGTALAKNVVALFGPTSAAEIELFGKGERIFSAIPCRTCYLSDCNITPNCMDLISPEEVCRAIVDLASQLPQKTPATLSVFLQNQDAR